MTSLTTTIRETKPATVFWVFGFALALAMSAQVTIPMPNTPVPFTLQPFIVVLAGLMLGPIAGASSMLLYLFAGAVGLPVFSPIGAPGILRFIGPTGGYLIAYPVAAWAAGALGAKQEQLTRRIIAACAGMAMIFVGGIAHLTVYMGSIKLAIAAGITPFILLDVVKAFIAAAVSGPRKRN